MNHTLVLEEYENAHPKCLPTFQSKSNHVLGVKDDRYMWCFYCG